MGSINLCLDPVVIGLTAGILVIIGFLGSRLKNQDPIKKKTINNIKALLKRAKKEL